MKIESYESILGNEEYVVLQMILQGCRKIPEICQFTGLSKSCVSAKIEVLSSLGFIEKGCDGYELTNKGFEWITTQSGANLIIV